MRSFGTADKMITSAATVRLSSVGSDRQAARIAARTLSASGGQASKEVAHTSALVSSQSVCASIPGSF